MFSINSIYVLALVIIFIIIFTTKLIPIRTYKVKDVLFDCSLFFDKISDDNDVKKKCHLTLKDFKKLKNNFDSFLVYINNLGYIKSKIFVINKDNCFFYDTNKVLKICNKYSSSDDQQCLKCRDFWGDFVNNPGKLLDNNLLLREGKKDVTLYKPYDCGKESTFIIGVICQDKY